jgi:hypothetical protein
LWWKLSGVWDKDDVLPLYTDPLNSGADSFLIRGPNDRVINVPLTSIDKLIAQLRLPRVDYIKMDIKGATGQGTRGCQGRLGFGPPQARTLDGGTGGQPCRDPVGSAFSAALLSYGVRNLLGRPHEGESRCVAVPALIISQTSYP